MHKWGREGIIRKNFWYINRFYSHSLYVTEWYIGIFFVSMTYETSDIQETSIFFNDIPSTGPYNKGESGVGHLLGTFVS